MKHSAKQPNTRARWELTCILLGLILVAFLGATLWLLLSRGAQVPLPPGLNAPQDSIPEEVPTLPPPETIPEVIGGKGSRIINILLVGQDRRENEGRTRADTMMVCTFNKKTRELVMTSFLRDLYVEIPGHGSNRINAAYAFGGMELLDATLNQNFGLKIDGTVEVDFSQFSSIVDLLGGVELELREDEAALINKETGSSLRAGLCRLNGEEALCYSRIRKLDSDGDFSRTGRQRKVLSALLDGFRGADLPAMLKLVSKVLPMVSTDLGTMDIMGYALELLPMLSDFEVHQQHIPAPGTYTDQYIDGMAVLVPDLEAARRLLAETLLSS